MDEVFLYLYSVIIFLALLNRLNHIVCFIIGALVLTLVIYKAAYMSFTHDEAFSYLHFVHKNSIDILSFDTPYTNNHILNTLLMKWSSNIFGISEFSLRLPNVLAFIGYMFASFSLFCLLENKRIVIPAFILMVANPYLIDFFSVARGYGLAISTMVTAIYFYSRYLENHKSYFYLLALMMAGLSVLANFTSLYFFFALLAFHVAFGIRDYLVSEEKNKRFLKKMFIHNKVTFIFIPVFVAVMYEPMRRMLQIDIDFGGIHGLWRDTVMTLINSTSYYKETFGLIILLKCILLLFMVGSILYWLLVMIKKRMNFFNDSKNQRAFFVNGVFFLIIVESWLHHQLTGTPYLSDRMALFLIPLFWLGVVFFLNQFRAGYFLIPVCLSLVLLFHTARNINSQSVFFWPNDRDNKSMIEFMEKEKIKSKRKEIQLGISWYFEPSLNFYRLTNELTWLKPFHRKGLQVNDDYCYILWEDSNKVADKNRYKVLQNYPLSNATLYQVVDK